MSKLTSKKKENKVSELEKFLARKAFNKKAETSGAAALSIGDLIYDMARIDPTYVKGAQFSRPEAVDISSKFKIWKTKYRRHRSCATRKSFAR